jgi:two-component system invasion response regulator UvrY
MIRVLICDDHRIVREGLKQMLADAPDIEVCAEAASGPEAVLAAVRAAAASDVVLLDIAMPQARRAGRAAGAAQGLARGCRC